MFSHFEIVLEVCELLNFLFHRRLMGFSHNLTENREQSRTCSNYAEME
ncbi:hypothetical protein BN938_0474 [Mucinivorans hirudinis]|uniref:Uncharacterized protein n=1 Tax=Mucinivorans hirudinis TaxID=1433126 RepID=A0A060RB10_9BACT|nr:hypothetical protein BN938_0474 [Mucinivorans hirudinis]